MKKRRKNKNEPCVQICNVCGKAFEYDNSASCIMVCSECKGDKEKALNRVFNNDTPFLVYKWYTEGDSIEKIARILGRSEANIIKAIEIGGAEANKNESQL